MSETRIYHPFTLWEDYKAGFYDNISGVNKEYLMNKSIEMFKSAKLTRLYMMRVIDEWKYSCEHNLTNPAMNRIAYIGQGACCIYANVPSTITMEAWSKLTKEVQNRSNQIAKEVIKYWVQNNKYIQLCLRLD
jgi:hypothetical protein